MPQIFLAFDKEYMHKRKILWLCSWYPDKLNPFNGDFIKRHAEAVATFYNVHIIHIVKDVAGKITNDVFIEQLMEAGLTEEVAYYYIRKNFNFLEKLQSYSRYQKLYKQLINEYILKNGKPDLVHVHIGIKAGAITNWINKKYGIKYVVSEHWSGFLENAEERFENFSSLEKMNWNILMKNASSVSAISQVLANGLKKQFSEIGPIVIPNVVNTNIFFQGPKNTNKSTQMQFVHISGMQPLKNPKLIIDAFQVLLEKYPSATLKMIGSLNEVLINYVKSKDLLNSISFYDEMPQTELRNFIQQSKALVLFSSYETFGCVLIEANACGIPVIVSDIPVFHEIIQQGVNGVFAKAGSTVQLASAMQDIAENKFSFNHEQIAAATTKKYSYPTVGKQFADWYDEIINQ